MGKDGDVYQSYLSGIKTSKGIVKQADEVHYQSYLSGIKTRYVKQSISAPNTINRTLVELKPDNALTRWLGRVPINRTLVELKLEV